MPVTNPTEFGNTAAVLLEQLDREYPDVNAEIRIAGVVAEVVSEDGKGHIHFQFSESGGRANYGDAVKILEMAKMGIFMGQPPS